MTVGTRPRTNGSDARTEFPNIDLLAILNAMTAPTPPASPMVTGQKA
jgi:hypothetical protein